MEAASVAWIFHEIRPVSYSRIWNRFLVFSLAVFSVVWDRTPCHPILNYLASNFGRVSLWVSNEHFTHFFFSQRLINMNDYDKKLYENVEDLMI